MESACVAIASAMQVPSSAMFIARGVPVRKASGCNAMPDPAWVGGASSGAARSGASGEATGAVARWSRDRRFRRRRIL